MNGAMFPCLPEWLQHAISVEVVHLRLDQQIDVLAWSWPQIPITALTQYRPLERNNAYACLLIQFGRLFEPMHQTHLSEQLPLIIISLLLPNYWSDESF